MDGVQQSRELFNKSNYQASPKIITIGTKDATKETLDALKKAVETGDEATVRGAASGLKTEEEAQKEEEDDKEKPDDEKDGNSSDDKKNGDKKGDDKKDNDKKNEEKPSEEIENSAED